MPNNIVDNEKQVHSVIKTYKFLPRIGKHVLSFLFNKV